jgi:hypothetical protein
MDQAYWLERERVSIAHARAATFPDIRLIYYDLAHKFSIEAANAESERLRRTRPKRRNPR